MTPADEHAMLLEAEIHAHAINDERDRLLRILRGFPTGSLIHVETVISIIEEPPR